MLIILLIFKYGLIFLLVRIVKNIVWVHIYIHTYVCMYFVVSPNCENTKPQEECAKKQLLLHLCFSAC